MKKILFYWLAFIFVGFSFVSCDDDTQEKVWKLDYSDCVASTSSSALEVVTMNLKEFPYEGDVTILYVSQLIAQLDADVIALQEIKSAYWLNRLAGEMDGWEGAFTTEPSGSMSLAYLYKTSEIELYNEETEAFYTDDYYAFLRPPFKIKVHHKGTGLDVYLINNHLKAMGGAENENRRRDASKKLKDYIDNNLDDQMVIVLGDYNDEIYENNNVFLDFIEDAANYKFADMDIAKGPKSEWSYPGSRYLSHLDHILITNELFDHHQSSVTIKPSLCQPEYKNVASDHRPVMAVFR